MQTRSMTARVVAPALTLSPPSPEVPTASDGSTAAAAIEASDMQLRGYQLRIAKECEQRNTLVVLPTGSGKTLIAAEVIKRLGSPALFLVPTCLLVEQQAAALLSWTELNIAQYMGGKAVPAEFDVLVTTPESFRSAQHQQQAGGGSGGGGGGRLDYSQLQWSAFRVVVFDEVHHVIKDHPYRKLALSLRKSSFLSSLARNAPHKGAAPRNLRVIGLTASYTYAIGQAKVEASLRVMCEELLISKCESATIRELQASGYHAIGATAEVRLPPNTTALSVSVTGVVHKKDRKAHKMVSDFFEREQAGQSTAFATRLMACVRAMEQAIVESAEHPEFTSPLPPSAKALSAKEWGSYAHKLARNICGPARRDDVGSRRNANAGRAGPIETVRPMLAELEHWYEAAKTLAVSWEEAEDTAAVILDMGGCGRPPRGTSGLNSPEVSVEREELWPHSVRKLVSSVWAAVPERFPRFEHLKRVLSEKFNSHGGDGNDAGGAGGTSFRGIIFVRERVTTHVLSHVIASDPELAPLFSTACLYASSSRATASLSVSKAQALSNLQRFRDGRVNLLLATVVAEEGMDVPAANCVIRFDPMEHAVSVVQGRGRARQEGSSFVVLSERADRPTTALEGAEQQQMRLVKNFEPVKAGKDAADAAIATIRNAQVSRERGARNVLVAIGAKVAQNGGVPPAGMLSSINIFSQRTKAVLEETWKKRASLWVCTLSYESPLREVHAIGEAPGKKTAKKLAAAILVKRLLALLPM